MALQEYGEKGQDPTHTFCTYTLQLVETNRAFLLPLSNDQGAPVGVGEGTLGQLSMVLPPPHPETIWTCFWP